MDPDPHHLGDLDQHPDPHQITIRKASNKKQEPDPHPSDRLDPETDPDPHQFADDKPIGMDY